MRLTLRLMRVPPARNVDYGCFDGQRKLDHTTERLQGGFKVPMETGRNLEHATERHQRGFKLPMETESMERCPWKVVPAPLGATFPLVVRCTLQKVFFRTTLVHTALLYLRNGPVDCVQIWCEGWGLLTTCFPQVMGEVHVRAPFLYLRSHWTVGHIALKYDGLLGTH